MSGAVKGVYLCRLCGRNTQNYIEIFNDEGVRRKLCTKAEACLQIPVSVNDTLPTIACHQCCNRLDDTWDFFQRAQKAQLILQNIFEPADEFHSTDDVFEVLVSKADILLTKQEYIIDKKGDIINGETAENNDNVSNRNFDENGEEIPQNNGKSVSIKIQRVVSVKNNEGEEEEEAEGEEEQIVIEEEDNVVVALDENEMEVDGHYDVTDDTTTVHEGITVRRGTPSPQKLQTPGSSSSSKSKRPENMKGYPWACTICDSGPIETHSDYCRHYTTEHQQAAIYKCNECGKIYEKYRSFARHISMHQATGNIKCDICGKAFTMKSALISHATVHTEDRPFHCDVCNKNFKRSATLTEHAKSHDPDTESKKFPCTFCDKIFQTKRSWRFHEKMHRGERDYTCDICGKSFVSRTSLIVHISSHDDTKNYECPICHRKFRTGRLMRRHTKSHSDIKPYSCQVCGKQFRERGSLKSHDRIHTGIMPYTCDVCGKKFRYTGILTVHKRQHTGEKPYECMECERRFTCWPNYNKHMKRIHKLDTSKQAKEKIEESIVQEEFIEVNPLKDENAIVEESLDTEID